MKKGNYLILMCVLMAFSLTANAQKISLTMRNVTVQQAISALQNQGYSISVKTDDVDLEKVISIDAQDQELSAVAAQIFSGQNVQFSIDGKVLVVTQAVAEAPRQQNARQQVNVSGRVVDRTGEPLIGAAILVKGTARGVSTDAAGHYSINALPEDVLEFSFIGFTPMEIPVGINTVINCTLLEDLNFLEDVVVVGYGTQSRKTLSSAIAKVDGEKLTGAPVSSVGEALKGKVTGLRITSNNNNAGEAPRFLIRGGSSINRSNDALTLVDGVERDINDLNPNDIESIEVFKDAASSAIYGARASNGVIVVTTKKGNPYKQPQIVFDSQMGVASPSRLWDMADATEFLTIVRPAAAQGPNASLVLDGLNGPGIGNITSTATYSTRYLNDGETVPEGYLSMADPINPSKTIIYTNKNWQKEWFRNVLYQKQYVGLNGGDQNLKYAASIGYLGDEGILPMNNYENLTMHGNTSFKVTKNLEASTTFDLSRGKIQPTTDNYFAAIGRGLMMSPTHIGRYPDGTFATGGTNKVQQSAEFYSAFYDRARITNRVMGSINLKWSMTDWLTAIAQYSYFDNNYRGSYYAHGEVDGTPNYIEQTRSTTETRTETTRNVFITYLTADKYFGKHHLQGTAGYDWSKWHYEYLTARNTGSLSDKIPYLTSGGDNTSGTMSMSNQRHDTALISYFARAQYSFADRYVLATTFRADGSSLFLGDNKWGYFPSVSGAWLISEEPFFKPVKEKMNMLKLRLSYGQTGNNSISRTAPLGAFSQGTYAGYNTILPSTMQNKDLRWETTTQLDLGLDLGLFNDRIRLVLDYYNKRTDDLIFGITLPDTAQLTSVQSNVGSVRFYGMEFELHTVNINKKDFHWTTDFTYSYNRNRVVALPEEYRYEILDMDGNPTGTFGYRIGGTVTASGYRYGGTAVGEPLGNIWGYKVAGILQTDEQAAAAYYDNSSHGYRRSDGLSIQGRKDAGDFEWVNRYGTAKTADGKEQIDGTDLFLIGNVMPHSIGGINNTINWKRFTFNIYFDYALGHSIYNYMKTRMMQNTLGYSNANIDVRLFNNSWRKPGDDATTARFFPNDADYGNRNYSRASNWNIERADYLCLRDASVFYDLPDRWANFLHMKKFTVGITGNTLWYFTRVSGAISPETGISTNSGSNMYSSTNNAGASGNLVPSTRKVLFNIKLTF
jgi:TonB-linked SusC/RagA family outer membrane protein